MSVVREVGLRQGCNSSTIFQNKTCLFEVALGRDVCPVIPYYQRVWAFLTSVPLHSPPVDFDRLRSFSFSIWPRFSVLSGPSPNLVQKG